MTNNSRSIRRQALAGYILISAALLIELTLINLVIFNNAPLAILIAGAPPSFILLYFGYKAYSASRNETILIGEQTENPYLKASQPAFWTLLSVIMLDDLFRFLPQGYLHESLIYIGIAAIIGFTLYHKYIPGLFSLRRNRIHRQ